jgi:hypothetical protein
VSKKVWARGWEFEDDFINQYSLLYLDYIRDKNCCVTGDRNAEPHHLKAVGMGNDRNKPMAEHFTTVPLSREMHMQVHNMGIYAFTAKYQINLWEESHYYLIGYLVKEDLLYVFKGEES